MRIGFLELIVIFAIILILFGGKQLPKLAQSLGKSKKILQDEFKSSEDSQEVIEERDEKDNVVDEQ